MKKVLFLILIGIMTLTLSGCKDETPQQSQQTEPAPTTQQAAQGWTGTVVETMNSGGYTYVLFDTGSEKIWAAAPEFVVEVGDPVIVPEGMPMQNHTSKTLDRSFDLIYFVDSVMVGGDKVANAGTMPEGHPDPAAMAATEEHARPEVEQTDIDMSGLEKAENGNTIGEIFSEKDALSGQEVAVRAKVVKFSPEIMGTNWIHIQDGTGSAGANDLTVTSPVTVEVGDTVLVEGVLTTDKDFGFGYKYDVIIEKADVTVE